MSDEMNSLKNGSTVRNLPALPSSTSPTLSELDELWIRMDGNTQSILERESMVLELAAASNSFIDAIPGIQELTDKAIRELTRNGASTQQVFVAGRQLVLSDRILRHLKEMLRGGSGSVTAADSLKQEIGYFEQTMNALLFGSRSVGVEQVTVSSARDALTRAQAIYEGVKPQLATILTSSSDILAVRGAADEIFADSLSMFVLSRQVANEILARTESRRVAIALVRLTGADRYPDLHRPDGAVLPQRRAPPSVRSRNAEPEKPAGDSAVAG